MTPTQSSPKPKKKPKSAAISIWATPADRTLYRNVSKRSGESLSKLVRVLVKNYNRTGAADGLPTISKKQAQAS